jgi:hypothetical protein
MAMDVVELDCAANRDVEHMENLIDGAQWSPTELKKKVFILDEIFGRDNFLNEIIWAYDYGARSKTRWPAKHDNIFYYAKDKNNYVFTFYCK